MSKFDILLRLSNDKLDAAAKRLQQAQLAQRQAESTFAQVDQFVRDYQQRILAMGQAGMGIASWQDARLFMLKLDEAREQQQKEVERSMQRSMLEKQAWQQARRQLKSYEALQQREVIRLQQKQAKQEQKLMDDFAARAAKIRQE